MEKDDGDAMEICSDDVSVATLQSLPNELHYRIMAHLDWRSLEKFGQTNRHFLNTSRHNGLWLKHFMEFRAFAMQCEAQVKTATYIKRKDASDNVINLADDGAPNIHNLSHTAFDDYMLGCRAERVLRWIMQTCSDPTSSIIFSYNNNDATLCHWPTQLHFTLAVPRADASSYLVISTEHLSSEIPRDILQVSIELNNRLSTAFCKLVAPLTAPANAKGAVCATDPMTIALSDENLSHYALRMPLRMLVTNPSNIWRTLLNLCWIDHVREQQMLIGASNCALFYNIKLRALLASEVAHAHTEYQLLPAESIVQFPTLTRSPSIETLRAAEKSNPLSALVCATCGRVVGLRNDDPFDAPRLSTLMPIANQNQRFCSSLCLYKALGEHEKHMVPCSNEACGVDIPLGQALGVLPREESAHQPWWLSTRQYASAFRTRVDRDDIYKLRHQTKYVGLEQLIDDVKYDMTTVDKFLDENAFRWSTTLIIGNESARQYNGLIPPIRNVIPTVFAPSSQGPSKQILHGCEWPADEISQIAYVSRFPLTTNDAESDSPRMKRFSLFCANIRPHLSDLNASFATIEAMRAAPGHHIYDLPFVTIGMDLPIIKQLTPYPFVKVDNNVGFESGLSYLRHIENTDAQLQAVMLAKFKCYCSAQCQRGVKGSNNERCLSTKCRRLVDPMFAPLTLGCMELVYVRVDEDGDESDTTHVGYVCDELCANDYLVERGAQLLRRKRKRQRVDQSRLSQSPVKL